MNKLTKYIVICCIGLMIGYQVLCYAGSFTQNGITVTTTGTKWYRYISATIQDEHNPGTSTATFNDAGGSTATSGAINVSGYPDILIQMRVATLGSTGIDFDIEGSVENAISASTVWGHVYTKSFSAVTTKDFGFPVHERTWKWIRIGTQATGTEDTDDISSFIRAKGRRGPNE